MDYGSTGPELGSHVEVSQMFPLIPTVLPCLAWGELSNQENIPYLLLFFISGSRSYWFNDPWTYLDIPDHPR